MIMPEARRERKLRSCKWYAMAMATTDDWQPTTVLAIGAHPDDMDFGAAGTLAKWAAAGTDVQYVVATDGGKGSADTHMTTAELIKARQAEQRAAAQAVGASQVHFLPYEDGRLEVTMALKRDLVRLIRQVRPDTVVTMDPTMVYSVEQGLINHPDHRAIGQATLDAVFPLARDHLSFPELYSKEHLEPHKVMHLLLTRYDQPTYFVDITDTMDIKIRTLRAHTSQLADAEAVAVMLQQRAAELGKQADCRYAEGFIRLDLAY